MQFIYPQLLWALGLLAIPIIIHLFYFRRFKKVYFSNVRFLQEIKQETSSRNKIKNLLILLMRLLAIASLIFAFAQPFMASNTQTKSGTKGVSIYVDNSFSMSAESDDESILQLAKKKAIQISEAYGETDKIQVFSSDFEGQHQRFVSQEEARGFIDQISSSPAVRNLSSVVNRAKQAMKTETFDNKIIYIISDFQTSISDSWEADSAYTINLIPLQAIKESNVSIDSAYIESGVAIMNQANTMKVVLNNHSDEDAENVRLTMNSNGQEKPVGSFDIKANSTLIVDAGFSPNKTGWQQGALKITDFPIVFDDTYNFSYYVNENVNILSINQSGQNKYVQAALKNIPYFNIENMSVGQIKYDVFTEQDLIILNDLRSLTSGIINELKQFVSNGGNLLIFPAANADKTTFNNLLASLKSNTLQDFTRTRKEVKTINTNEFVFDGVFESRQSTNLRLPISEGQYNLSSFQNTLKTSLLKYRDGSDYITKSQLELGYVYLCAAPLNPDENDLVNNAEIFVPMIYKMALSKADGSRLAYTVGKDQVLMTDAIRKSAEQNFKMVGPREFIPGQFNNGNQTMLDLGNQIKESGFYQLQLDDIDKGLYAFNYDLQESALDYYSTEDLEKQYGGQVNIYSATANADFTQLINEKESGVRLWRWFLIACLLFLLLEQLFIRFLK